MEKVEAVDPKAKKDPKAAATKPDFTEEEEAKFENRIIYQLGDAIEEP